RAVDKPRYWSWLPATAGVFIVLAAALAWIVPSRSKVTPPIMLLTPFQGNKVAPALSPDGRFVAFSSIFPEGGGKADIWIKSMDGETLRLLTDTPEFTETSPAWSPDGREIAFLRAGKGVFVVPESGGTERRIAETGTWVRWAADRNSILVR